MQKFFRENHEVLLINYTYKINKYKMLLLIIIEVISLNIIFYVNFCFMKEERHNDYIWVLKALKRLYDHFNLSYFEIVLFNDDKTLTSALFEMFEDTVKHALCVWHININITINIKKYFSINEFFESFIKRWNDLRNAFIFAQLEKHHQKFYMIYLKINVRICEYLKSKIWSRRRKWIKCYIDVFLHFENIFTSRDENEHQKIKTNLQFLIDERWFW